ncbi:VIT family-domain-containing protein [Obelidium mucronatum]|nr:VIT family-domain-containing protein [Obelidium mucronatum]
MRKYERAAIGRNIPANYFIILRKKNIKNTVKMVSPDRKNKRKKSPSRPQSPQHQVPQSVVLNMSSSNDRETTPLLQHEHSPARRSANPSPSRSVDSHDEPHFEGAEIIRDVVVGLSDGLTVPFALTAGLASLGNSRFVVLAGMAEIVAGAISMGLGGYLAGKSEIEHYESEYAREQKEVIELPEREEEEIIELFEPYELDRTALQPLLDVLKANPDKWVEFMMKYELNLEKPDPSRVWVSALTIGGSYFMGGLVPLIPYMIIEDSYTALYYSIVSTLLVLLVFGFVKGKLVGVNSPVRSALEMMIVGAAASGAAFWIAKAMPQPESFIR